jgi:hypothetical protein
MEIPGPELPVSIAFDYQKKLWSECKTAGRDGTVAVDLKGFDNQQIH